MKLSYYARWLFLALLVTMFATIIKPLRAHAMACCKDLNCEGRYTNCVSACADQSCMDSCLSAADRCAQTLCDVDCGDKEPCWFASSRPEGCSTAYDTEPNNCFASSDCTFPFVCLGGRCAEGGCGLGFECTYGYACDNGFCQFGCDSDFDCGTGHTCQSGICH